MIIPFGHHELHNRYCFEGELELVTPLRISSGRASDETDAPFMRMFDGAPYIPGTSLRGAIRSELERILSVVGERANLTSCILFEEGDCAGKAKDFILSLDRETGRKHEGAEKKKDQRIAEFAERELCHVCKLFGSTVYASRLIIEDSLPAAGDPHELQKRMRIRDGVGIDRDTGAAKDGAKFDYEVIEPGVDFVLRMTAENVGSKDKKLISLILNLLEQGIFIGGKRSGGLGKIRLKNIDGAKIKVTGFEDPQSLWDALVAGKNVHGPIEWGGAQC